MPDRSFVRFLATGCAALFTLVTAVIAKPIASQGTPGGTVSPAPPAVAGAEWLDERSVGEPQFDTSFQPVPPNVPSVGFEATGTSEFGDLVRLAGHVHHLDSVTVTLSSWALRSQHPGGSALGFTHPITLRLYRVDRRTGTPRIGDPLVTITQPFLIPWRPEPDATSASPLRPWRSADGNLYTGRAFTVTFDLGELILTLPDEIIFGISFNTQHHGPAPLGVPGPYNSLHVGLAVTPPTVGSDLDPDAVFWRAANPVDYADRGATGANVFRRDTAWTPFKPAVRFNTSAYGALAVASAQLGGLPAADAKVAAALERACTLTGWALERRLWDGNSRLQPSSGRLVFDLLAEAAAELRPFAPRGGKAGAEVQVALSSLLRVATTLAETAAGEALIGGGQPARLVLAQDALDEAQEGAARGRIDQAIDELGNAWREADLAVR